MDEIIQIIQTLGFPIACVIALFWQNNRLNEQHKEETRTFTEAINNNTQALTQLKDKLERA